MTDGPFKNLKLDSRSKRFVEAVRNDAESNRTRQALAGDAILHGILSENQPLIRELQAYGQNVQLDLDHDALIKSIFDTFNKSEFADHLQREISFRQHEGEGAEPAVNNGFEAALETGICKFRNRIHEACLEVHGRGEMRSAQFDRFIDRSNETLRNIDRPRILKAFKDGNKNAFKLDVKKKAGVDEGPQL